MKILFIHQGFPGQFKHLAPALARLPGYDVRTLTLKEGLGESWHGVRIHNYRVQKGSTKGIHPWVLDMESKVIRGDACFRAALALKEQGYYPDVIVAHHGWGESLFLKELWPESKLGIYCEYFYKMQDGDVNFDPEFPAEDPAYCCRIRLKNANNLLHFDIADAALSPTQWQADSFPEPFRSRITVIHEGIDTEVLAPSSDSYLLINDKTRLTSKDEIITFVNRNFEPTRGYHIFMRSLPAILKARPKARVFLIGGDGVSYGAKNKDGESWKEKYIKEIKPQMSGEQWSRVHFTGKLPYKDYIRLLQLSSVHVYLTYPFVLSWSLLEAMSIGCTVVASDTGPLKEVVTHGENGRLVSFFDHDDLARQIIDLLGNPKERQRLSSNARAFAQEHYDLKTVCLPKQIQWVKGLASDEL